MVNDEEKLKAEYLSWLESVKVRRAAYEQAKRYLNQTSVELKKAKNIFYSAYKEWKRARIEAARSRRKWQTYPYRLRHWAKNNMDKVWGLLENGK